MSREQEFVGGYHEERTEKPHAQQNLRVYSNTGIWDYGYGWGNGGGYGDNFGQGATDGGEVSGDGGDGTGGTQ